MHRAGAVARVRHFAAWSVMGLVLGACGGDSTSPLPAGPTADRRALLAVLDLIVTHMQTHLGV